jgi:rhomboid protease GluP
MIIIYTVAGVAGFALSSFAGAYIPDFLFLRGGRFTVGASASIFGLLGAIVYYGRRSGSRHVSSQAWSYTLSMGVFGLLMPGIDNWAHGGGFAAGYLTALVLDPLSPVSIDHMGFAVVCLLLSVLSVIVSVINGVQFFG